MKTRLSLFAFAAVIFQLCAADIYVDYEKGKAANPGTKAAPYARFASAIKAAQPGDTIYILPSTKPIRDTLVVRKKCGTADKPIIIDGMNNIFLGTEPLDLKVWKEFKPGYLKRTMVASASRTNRYFMVRDGKPHRMGRFNKAKGSKAYKKVEELQPGEWTIIRGKQVRKKVHKHDFILRLPEGAKTPAGFEEPLSRRISGVNIADECHYLTFRNIIVKNFLNDGYNIHGNCRNIRFENIAALYCGDDGISAHETCLIYVKNFIAIGCSTAACHINKSENHHENVYAEQILGRDLFFTDNTTNTFKNVWIKANSIGGFRLTTRKNSVQNFTMTHARIINTNPKATAHIQNEGKLNAKFSDIKFANYSKVDKIYSASQVKPEDIAGEIEAARKRLFALFNGQIEKALALFALSNGQIEKALAL